MHVLLDARMMLQPLGPLDYWLLTMLLHMDTVSGASFHDSISYPRLAKLSRYTYRLHAFMTATRVDQMTPLPVDLVTLIKYTAYFNPIHPRGNNSKKQNHVLKYTT